MKKRLNILLVTLLLLLAGTFSVSAQIVDAEGQYMDTVFNDNVDRDKEDFVIASLLVADPGTVLFSVLGHACIRLQCPSFNMDYCFSYEGEDGSHQILSFFAGKLMMGLLAIPTNSYCAGYKNDGRGVYEYELHLPIDVKRELWRVLDEHLAEGLHLSYDYYHRGCTTTTLNFVKEALGTTNIVYDESLFEYATTARELCIKHSQNAKWVQFFALFLAGSETDELLLGDKQLIIPIDLVNAWQHAKVNGRPLLASEPNVLVKGKPQIADGWFTPMLLAISLLILAIVNLFWKRPYLDWLMLVAQTVIGSGMTYLIVFSNLCCTSWNWLLIPFNPLPAIFWYWRKYWALPYAGILLVWCISMAAMTIFGHPRVNGSHIVMILAWIIIILKQANINKNCNEYKPSKSL